MDYLDGGDDGEDDEPEPEEDVDLLVNDVQGKNTKTIKLLDSTRRTKLVELAFGHLKFKHTT